MCSLTTTLSVSERDSLQTGSSECIRWNTRGLSPPSPFPYPYPSLFWNIKVVRHWKAFLIANTSRRKSLFMIAGDIIRWLGISTWVNLVDSWQITYTYVCTWLTVLGRQKQGPFIKQELSSRSTYKNMIYVS